jgi:hypothetical protein
MATPRSRLRSRHAPTAAGTLSTRIRSQAAAARACSSWGSRPRFLAACGSRSARRSGPRGWPAGERPGGGWSLGAAPARPSGPRGRPGARRARPSAGRAGTLPLPPWLGTWRLSPGRRPPPPTRLTPRPPRPPGLRPGRARPARTSPSVAMAGRHPPGGWPLSGPGAGRRLSARGGRGGRDRAR